MFSLIVFLGLLTILFFCFWSTYKDILAPTLVLILSFAGASSLLLKAADRLEIKDISFETIALLFTGVFFFAIGSIISRTIFSNKTRPYSVTETPIPINISELVLIPFVLFSSFVAYIQFKHEVLYVGYVGAFTEIVSDYRDAFTMDDEVPQNTFVLIFSRIIYALQPLAIFLVCYNKIVCKKRIHYPIILCVCFITYLGSIFVIAGSRGRIFSVLFQILFTLSICYNFSPRSLTKKKKRSLPGNKIWLKATLLVVLIGIPAFYYVGVIQGKKYEEMSTFEPVENYFSYGLIHLDHTVKVGTYKSKEFGQWSFSGYYSLMNKLGENHPRYDSIPFYDRYGNTLTMFGRWYQDFNIIGIVIMAFLTGGFFTYVYCKMIYSKNSKQVLSNSVFYLFFIDIIIMASYDDWVKGQLSLNGFFQIFFLNCVLNLVKNKMTSRCNV